MRFLLYAFLVFALTLCFSWAFGHIPFSDNAAYAFGKLAGQIGIYGVERVEDFYMILTLFVSFIAALVIVLWVAHAVQRKR